MSIRFCGEDESLPRRDGVLLKLVCFGMRSPKFHLIHTQVSSFGPVRRQGFVATLQRCSVGAPITSHAGLFDVPDLKIRPHRAHPE